MLSGRLELGTHGYESCILPGSSSLIGIIASDFLCSSSSNPSLIINYVTLLILEIRVFL